MELVKDVRKLAVLRANAIGDYLVSLPALEALGAAYPQAELVLLGAGWHTGFLAGRPGPVDRCVPVPPTVGVRDDQPPAPPAEVDRFFARMRTERFDLAVQLQGGGRHSNPFLRRLGARVTAGSQAPNAPPLDRTVPYTRDQHEIHRFLEVVGLVGATPVTLEPRLQVTAADRAEAAGRPCRGRSAAGHPASRGERPAAALAGGAAGGGRERAGPQGGSPGCGRHGDRAPLVDRLLDRLDGHPADLAGRLGLGGLAGLLVQATLLVGNDSGPRHLAAAVGTATVAVYWCVSLGSYGPLYRARHRAPTAWRLHCPVCGATASSTTAARSTRPRSWLMSPSTRSWPRPSTCSQLRPPGHRPDDTRPVRPLVD